MVHFLCTVLKGEGGGGVKDPVLISDPDPGVKTGSGSVALPFTIASKTILPAFYYFSQDRNLYFKRYSLLVSLKANKINYIDIIPLHIFLLFSGS